MASSPKSHKELMKQDAPIKFDAIFSRDCLVTVITNTNVL